MYIVSRYLLQVAFTTLVLASTHVAAAQDTAAVPVDQQLAIADYGEDGELILQLYLRDIRLTDGLFSLVREEKIYLPLGELTALLEFPIIVDVDAGYAAGWFIDPANKITVSRNKQTVDVSGTESKLTADSIISDVFDLYVDSVVLETWFPVKFDFDLVRQSVTIRSLQPLPAELARERAGLEALPTTTFRANKPYTVPGYRLLDWPSVAVDVGGVLTDDEATNNYDYRIRALGDLAFLNGRLSASGSNNEVDSLRLTLGRKDPSGMLGSLNIADFEVGDTTQFLPGQIGSSLSGRGLRFGNTRLSSRRDLDTIDLQGDLLADYEVELYINNQLLGIQRKPENGQYQFSQIPLRLGQNQIRLEFYGPQGQRRTETQQSFVGSGSNQRGQLGYEFAAVQPGRLVFEDINNQNITDDTEDGINSLSGALNLSYGLTRQTSLALTIASLANDTTGDSTTGDVETLSESILQNRTYLNAQLNTSVFGSLVSYEVTSDDDNNLAGALRLRTRQKDYEISLAQSIFSNDYRRFQDIAATDNSQLPRALTTASISRVNKRVPGGSASYGADINYGRTQSNIETIQANTRLDYYTRYISGSWAHGYNRNLNVSNGSSSGRVSLSLRPEILWDWLLGTELSYADTEDSLIQGASLRASRGVGEKGSLSLQVTRDLQSRDLPDEKNRYSASWNQQLRFFRLSSSLSGSSTEDIALRFGVSFNATRFPNRILPSLTTVSSGTSPRVAALVFVDDNNNLTHDYNEETVEGVRITRNGLLAGAVTGQDGIAIVDSLSSNSSADLDIVETDITDVTLRPVPVTKGILPRPGRIPVVHIPLQRVTDIEGTITVNNGTPAPNVRLFLTPTDGGQPLEARTEFDGVYYLTGVPLGSYLLGPDAEQLRAAGLVSQPETRLLELQNLDDFPEPEDFVLARITQAGTSPALSAALPGIDTAGKPDTVTGNEASVTTKTIASSTASDPDGWKPGSDAPSNPDTISWNETIVTAETFTAATTSDPNGSKPEGDAPSTPDNTSWNEAKVTTEIFESSTASESAGSKPGNKAASTPDTVTWNEAESIDESSASTPDSNSTHPTLDSDNDGVLNIDDQCEHTSRASKVNELGCVHVGEPLSNVSFAPGASNITTTMAFGLNGLARELKSNPSLKVKVETHTDNDGNANKNMALAKRRARSILNYLVQSLKVPSAQLSAVAFGESQPIASNRTRAGRQKNRRIIIRLVASD